MLPNYLSKLVSGIKGTNFMNILQEKFKRFSFFYDKTAGRWMNGLLERLESDSEARERFELIHCFPIRMVSPIWNGDFLIPS